MGLIPLMVRHALRRLASTPFLTIGSIGTLALGIGSAVVTVDVLDRILLRAPAHVSDPDRLAGVYISAGAGSYIEVTRYSTHRIGIAGGLERGRCLEVSGWAAALSV